MALPPRRFSPWIPPVHSPAAYRPGIGSPSALQASDSTFTRMPPMVWCTVGTLRQAYQGPSVMAASAVLSATKPNSSVPPSTTAL